MVKASSSIDVSLGAIRKATDGSGAYLVSSLHAFAIMAASSISAAYLPPPMSRKTEEAHTSLIGSIRFVAIAFLIVWRTSGSKILTDDQGPCQTHQHAHYNDHEHSTLASMISNEANG